MARETVTLCDFEQGACRRVADSYRLWRDGDKQARTVDLCEEHAAPLLTVFEGARETDLPTKPRARMDVTKLVTTPKTARYKKG